MIVALVAACEGSNGAGFQPCWLFFQVPWGVAPGWYGFGPLALRESRAEVSNKLQTVAPARARCSRVIRFPQSFCMKGPCLMMDSETSIKMAADRVCKRWVRRKKRWA